MSTSNQSWLTSAERDIVRALARAILPAGERAPGAGEVTIRRAESLLAELPAAARAGWRSGLWALELRSVLRFGGRFSKLPLGRQLEALEAWNSSHPTRLALRGVLTPLKLAHFDAPETYAALGQRYVVTAPAKRETARWREQVTDASKAEGDLELECEAVVVGTGAGGAPVAAELAGRGFAVLLLEEGQLHDRTEFTGRPWQMMRAMYRNNGLTVALGNTAIPVPTGIGVGGTTLINSGTCFKTPDEVLQTWASEGLTGLSPEPFSPYLDRVWRELEVGPSSPKALGRTAELIARGCDALGWSHHPLDRNAPGCDGQGVCYFGCPTDAKRSTNLSYVPKALDRGAQLLTGVRVEKVLLEHDRAVGVEGVATRADGRKLTVRVRAQVVVLACGTLATPALLLKQGLCNASGEVGKNLSLHPAAGAVAMYDEKVNGWTSVPQGYAIDEFKHEGIYFEGSTLPLELQAATLWSFGPGYMRAMERYDRTVGFGFMVKDTSRGRVRLGRGGEPLITYWLNQQDVNRVHRGLALLSRAFFAGGATEVFLPVGGWDRLRDVGDIEAFEKATLAARDLDLSAYHPLGTSRMGVDPFSSVVNGNHETHDVHNLYVCDGSAVPGPPGVNPQITIMAMALRAAELIARRLEKLHQLSAVAPARSSAA